MTYNPDARDVFHAFVILAALACIGYAIWCAGYLQGHQDGVSDWRIDTIADCNATQCQDKYVVTIASKTVAILPTNYIDQHDAQWKDPRGD